MGVTSKGWAGGDGSAADTLYRDGDIGSRQAPDGTPITMGPLAYFEPGIDPIAHTESMRRRAESELSKTARVLGEQNNFDSTPSPGGNRTTQGGDNVQAAEIQQKPDQAGPKGSQDGVDKKPTSATGAKGSSLLSKVKGNIEKNRASESVGESGDSEGSPAQKPGHNLLVQNSAPVPKEFKEQSKPGNLGDRDQKSAWTGSGPNAALHEGYQKVGELLDFADQPLLTPERAPVDGDTATADDGDVVERLKTAGVPVARLENSSLLWSLAAESLVKEASAEGDGLLREDIHPLKIAALLDDRFGEEWRDWEPETIQQSVGDEMGMEPGDVVMNKIMAVKIAMKRPELFYDDWNVMEKIAVAFNDVAPTMGVIEDVPVEWLSNAVSVMNKIAGDVDFGAENRSYVAARLFDSGYVVAPPLLRFADSELGEKVADDALRRKVIVAYARQLGSDKPVEGEDPVSIQVARIFRNHAYVIDKLEEGANQVSA